MVIALKIDKFDIFFGLSDKTKEKMRYWFLSLFFSILVLFLKRSEDSFLHLEFPSGLGEAILFSLSIFFIGLVAYSLILGSMIVTDIHMFKTEQKKSFIDKSILNLEQKDKVMKKIRARKELYTVVIKPKNLPYELTEQQWRYCVSKIGNRSEVAAKAKFLFWVEQKIKNNSPLNEDELLFLNELLFSTDDLKLLSYLRNG